MPHNPGKPARQRYLAKRKATLKEHAAAKKLAKKGKRAAAGTGEGSGTVGDEMLDTAMPEEGALADDTHEPEATTPHAQATRSGPLAGTASHEEPSTAPPSLATPNITENDLLAFQLKHFGDPTKPDNFFVGYDAAWNYELHQQCPAEEEEEDDLGYYADGVKRTITDAEIAFFRRSELEKMLVRQSEREGDKVTAEGSAVEEYPAQDFDHAEALAEQQSPSPEKPEQEKIEMNENTVRHLGQIEQAQSEGSKDAEAEITADLEDSALHGGLATKSKLLQHERFSGKRDLSLASIGELRRRHEHVPYAQRNKRRWEKYIEDEEDPAQGWITRNRKIRELDEIKAESLDLEY